MGSLAAYADVADPIRVFVGDFCHDGRLLPRRKPCYQSESNHLDSPGSTPLDRRPQWHGRYRTKALFLMHTVLVRDMLDERVYRLEVLFWRLPIQHLRNTILPSESLLKSGLPSASSAVARPYFRAGKLWSAFLRALVVSAWILIGVEEATDVRDCAIKGSATISWFTKERTNFLRLRRKA